MKSWITTLLIGVSLCRGSSAQADSNRTIRLVVPFDAGGPADLVARILAERLGPALGGTVIVENRRGANGMIAMGQVARAKPDGSTLVFATSGMLTISPVLYRSLPYSPLRDFVPVSRVVVNGTALVVAPNIPANNMHELVEYAKQRDSPLTLGSAGVGNVTHLYVELLKRSTNLDMMHVPYKGIAPAMIDVVGGHIDAVFADFPISLPQVRAGKVKVIGIVGTMRSAAAPDIPTIAEQGYPGVDGASWFGILAPAETPPQTVRRLNEAIANVLNETDVKSRLNAAGSERAPTTPEQMATLIRAEQGKWAAIIRSHNLPMK